MDIRSIVTRSSKGLTKLSKNQLKNMIQEINTLDFLLFLNYKSFEITIEPEMTTSEIIYSSQTIANATKWLLAFGDFSISETKQWDTQRYEELMLAFNDYLATGIENSNDLPPYLFSNLMLNNSPALLNIMVRNKEVYTEIAPTLEEYDGEFLNINQDFSEKHQVSINEYFAILFYLYTASYSVNPRSRLNTEAIFQGREIKHKADFVFEGLSMSIEYAKDWASKNINQEWKFDKIFQFPCLKLGENNYLPLNHQLITKNYLEGIYHKVQFLYNDQEDFNAFFGRPFEKFATKLMEDSIKNSKNENEYEFFDEFTYNGENGEKRSPDIMVRKKDKLIVFEIKSALVKFASETLSSIDSIEEDLNKLIIDPVYQMSNRIKELKSIDHEVTRGAEEIHLVSVTQGYFPYVEKYENEANHKISLPSDIEISSVNHIDMEEFEMICSLVEKDICIIDILYSLNDNLKNHLFNMGYTKLRPSFYDDKFTRIKNEWIEIFNK